MPINITMPALSPTMTTGNLARWLKSEGDTVESGDVIAEIETDKATMEVEAIDDGIIGKIIVPEGTQNVPVNDVIAVLLEDGESVDDIDMSSAASSGTPVHEEKKVEKPTEVKATPATPATPAAQSGERVFASPLAKRLAKEKGIDLAHIQGTGPRGRIVKADIEKTKNAPAPVTNAPQTDVAIYDDPDVKTNIYGMAYKEIPNNNIRKVVAKRLTESKQEIPHFYLTVDCILDNLLLTRKTLNDIANGEYKLSVNDFIMKAAAMALKSYPAANVSWSEEAIHQYLKADVCVAISTPHGLITPIIKAAEDKGLREISAEVKDLASRARENKLKPEEFQGGTFTVSNLGMFGVKEFSPIINPPQGCILAVGAGEQRPVVEHGEIKIRTVMSCTLSVDHRCVDGAVGAEYLQIFKQYIETPAS
ncbi:MAG: pyruvate dehydrogenase complex dihydrolipoamide acetyltransferase, partial [Alphaproteobacteria bacterium]|nr:pyruvate dehydrogenase complex dihydrolipoamide acetyltransferase [Alphaproteobacteria bacterium]